MVKNLPSGLRFKPGTSKSNVSNFKIKMPHEHNENNTKLSLRSLPFILSTAPNGQMHLQFGVLLDVRHPVLVVHENDDGLDFL